MNHTIQFECLRLIVALVACMAVDLPGWAQTAPPISMDESEILLRGMLLPNKTITLRAATSGIVKEHAIGVGQSVRGGHVLLKIESREINRRRRQLVAAQRHAPNTGQIAQNSLNQADIFSQELQTGIQKATTIKNQLSGRLLFQRPAAKASSAVEKLQNGLAQVHEKRSEISDKLAEAQQAVIQATAAVTAADELADFATIVRSPVDGVVSKSFVREHEHVVVSQPVAEIVQLDPMQIVVWLSPETIAVTKRIAGVLVRPKTGVAWQAATVRTLSPVIDQRTGHRPLLLFVDNKSGRYVAGTNVDVRVQLE